MTKRIYIFFLCQLIISTALAQTTFPSNGAPSHVHNVYAFTNATIYADYEIILKNATLLIRDGKVLGLGEKIDVPKDAVVYDLKGKFIYPSFIDLYSDYGLPENRYEHK